MTVAISNAKLVENLNSWLQISNKNIWNMLVSCNEGTWVSYIKVSKNTKREGLRMKEHFEFCIYSQLIIQFSTRNVSRPSFLNPSD